MTKEMQAFEKYEYAVNFKTDSFKEHPKYAGFRKMIDTALNNRVGYGWDAIAAETVTDLIILRDLEEIRAYLDGVRPLGYTKEEQVPYKTAELVHAAYEKICAETIGVKTAK